MTCSVLACAQNEQIDILGDRTLFAQWQEEGGGACLRLSRVLSDTVFTNGSRDDVAWPGLAWPVRSVFLASREKAHSAELSFFFFSPLFFVRR